MVGDAALFRVGEVTHDGVVGFRARHLVEVGGDYRIDFGFGPLALPVLLHNAGLSAGHFITRRRAIVGAETEIISDRFVAEAG